ncbi:hypothetical protein [Pandoraea sputorum]|uniref:hypothetical protein n=1 Tax=Pandoraea sputorum TaxID=93222 RepID=UPI002F4055C7
MDDDVMQEKHQLYEDAARRRGETEEKIRRGGKIDIGACYATMSNSHFVIGMYDYIAKRDVSGMKQNLYTACKLHLASLILESEGRLQTPMPLLWAVLSDSSLVIDEMSSFDQGYFSENRKNPRYPQFMVHMYQMAIKSDFDGLRRNLDLLKKKGRREDQSLLKSGKDFFSLLMLRDKESLEKEISAKVTAEASNAMAEGIISVISTLEAKICWMHGIEVAIDNELVPKDLLPVRPLARYLDDYEFLSPGYRKKGLISRLFCGIFDR